MSTTGMSIEDLAREWQDAERAAARSRRRLVEAVAAEVAEGATTRPLGRRIGVSGETVRAWVLEARALAELAEAESQEVAGQLSLV